MFDDRLEHVADFVFDKAVAKVFDDMVSRSVPQYREIQRMIVELAGSFATEGSNIYDLGCSTGTTLALLRDSLSTKTHLFGVDASTAMLDQCRRKFATFDMTRDIDLCCADLDKGIALENASVVSLVLTLMFVRPLNRETLIADIYSGLNENGCLLLVEKVLGERASFNRLFIEHYYAYKRRVGYSELEIAQKREALENVLIPYRLGENIDLLTRAGFRDVDVFFKWYNFAGIVAVK
jgi:tRNA (cmo5U34)-methyltransferase